MCSTRGFDENTFSYFDGNNKLILILKAPKGKGRRLWGSPPQQFVETYVTNTNNSHSENLTYIDDQLSQTLDLKREVKLFATDLTQTTRSLLPY